MGIPDIKKEIHDYIDIIIDYQMEGSSGAPGPNYTTYLKVKNVYVGRTKAY